MMKFNKILCLMTVALSFFIFSTTSSIYAGTIHTHNQKDNKDKTANESEKLQSKTYSGVFDLQKNTVSNIDFYTTNYGIFAFDARNTRGGGYWPRGSQNQYIFAGGFWFAAKKYLKNSTDTNAKSLVAISYNPWSGRGWFVPGRINEGGPNSTTADVESYDGSDIYKYRTYFSIDFKTGSGEPTDPTHQYNWPIWDASTRVEDTLKTKRYFGHYIPQTDLRNTNNFKKGPAFISSEDIFSTYKDTDLSRYEGGASVREKGYPLRMQVEQMIYSWGFGDYRDFIFIKYELTNYSKDTLWQCWLAPVMDVDIARAASASYGAGNDRVKFYECDGGDTLNMAIQWSNTDRGERGFGFGYLGFDFLESPAVVKYYDTTYKEIRDDEGNIIRVDTIKTQRLWDEAKDGLDAPRDYFVRKDSAYYANSSQLGLVTFNNWPIEQDKQTDDERYQFMAAGVRQGDDGPGDKRFMMSTGPFHMRPADTVRVVVGIILANAAKGGEADGTCEDLNELARKDKFAQSVYDNNFRAPVPPDRSMVIESINLNNGNIIKWDNTAELSVDVDEKGLDFMGYSIYRARRTDLDAYDENKIAGNSQFPSGKGPFGWKLVQTYGMLPPFYKSTYSAGGFSDNPSFPKIDDFSILGPYMDDKGNVIDTMAIRVMRTGAGMRMGRIQVPYTINSKTVDIIQPYIISIDTSGFYTPWGLYWKKIIDRDPTLQTSPEGTITRKQGNTPLYYSNNLRNEIFDSVTVGVIHLDRSLLKFNPLFYEQKTLIRNMSWYNQMLKTFPDGVVGSYFKKYDEKLKDSVIIRTSTDSIYIDATKRVSEGTNYAFDVWVPRDWRYNMGDTVALKRIQDSLYSYIQGIAVKLEIADLQQRKEVREEVISPYMQWVTNNRTFTDIGDDNGDGYIDENEDPAKTERLLNNIEYYYKVLANDEGDFLQPTNNKLNTGGEGLPNFKTSIPTAAPVGKAPEIQVIHVDSSLVGGLYNFKFFSVDPDRVIQKFEGDSLVLKFEPFWDASALNFRQDQTGQFGLYRSLMTLTSKKTGDTLYAGFALYEDQTCNFSYTNLFSENAASVVLTDSVIVDRTTGDSVDFGTPFAKGQITRTGRFYSGDFTYPGYCYTSNWHTSAYGILGFSFDFTITQLAGRFRPDSLTLTTAYGEGVTATTPINFVNDPAILTSTVNTDLVMSTQVVGVNYTTNQFKYGSFNNGPGIYELEFLPGGTETKELAYNKNKDKNTFNVPYLNVKVRNLTELKIPAATGDSIGVHYPTDMPHLDIPPVTALNESSGAAIYKTTRLYPDPRNLSYLGRNTNEFIGKFNIHAFGFISNAASARTTTADIRLAAQIARPVDPMYADAEQQAYTGFQGKYMMSSVSIDGKDTLDFVNMVNISGVQFALDFANKGKKSNKSAGNTWKANPDYNIWTAQDFKAGDKIYLRTTGGALGLPLPGATIIAKVSTSTPINNDYTDEMLDGVQVVPNPYYITHQGIKSPYDTKIYFTKLPKKCTIEIYTIAGDLIKTLQHDEYNNDGEADRNAVQVWDLLSKNESRVQSQAFVAVISTPNGAQTVKNFSVVVGGFRLLDDK
ncbi:MAG TPA: hypothetical protein PLE30_07995 [Candidatus Kapabacteria bacterium]|nr:hypothetical protein [Candidatus Kapabacteria bacterium]